jgi:hypothetical protein
LLSDQAVYEELLEKWKEHPARFERNHLCLWHLLDGDMLYHMRHPFVPAFVPAGDLPVHSETGNPQGGGESGNHHDEGPGGGIHSTSVPEPSSAALLVSAAILVLLAAAGRRAYEWLKPRRRACA